MDRIACISLPEFPLQLLLRRHPEWIDLPAVVVDRDKAQGTILWANRHARATRILPGMRYAAALSLSRELRAAEVPESEIAEHVDAITARLRFYSADVEPSPEEPGVFWINGSGLRLLFPSLRKWADLIYADLCDAGYSASVAVGFSRFGTYATARTSRGVTAFDGAEQEQKHSARVRIDRLGFEPSLRDALAKLGITTVGGFLDLPANGIKKRFGADVYRLHQLARGELYAPLVPQPPHEPIRIDLHLDYPESNLERLVALVEKHLNGLLARLNERSELLAAVNVRLRFDDRKRAAERLQPANPTLEVAQIVDLIRLRLGSLLSGGAAPAQGRGVSPQAQRGNTTAQRNNAAQRTAAPVQRGDTPTAGVVDLEMEVEGTPAERRQGELFEEKSPRDLDAAARAFARLRAEFGDDVVVKAVPRDGHLPEATWEWQPMLEQTRPKARAVKLPPLVRRIYGKPVVFSPGKQRDADMQLTAHIDDGSIRETKGPYIVSGGWWQREVQREYYFVHTANGRTLWMFYDRRRMCWYIHGEVS